MTTDELIARGWAQPGVRLAPVSGSEKRERRIAAEMWKQDHPCGQFLIWAREYTNWEWGMVPDEITDAFSRFCRKWEAVFQAEETASPNAGDERRATGPSE